MQEASIPGLMWILIIILGYYVVKWIRQGFSPGHFTKNGQKF